MWSYFHWIYFWLQVFCVIQICLHCLWWVIIFPDTQNWDLSSVNRNKFGHLIKILHCDNGGEYCNTEFKDFLTNFGITLETTAPNTPEQNARAERDFRTILESARSMIYRAKDSLYNIWVEAINCAFYKLNRTPTVQMSYEKWCGENPKLEHVPTYLKVLCVFVWCLLIRSLWKSLSGKVGTYYYNFSRQSSIVVWVPVNADTIWLMFYEYLYYRYGRYHCVANNVSG